MLIPVFSVALVVSSSIGAGVSAQAAPTPQLTEGELDALYALFDEAHFGLLARVSGLTDEQWTFRTQPDRWSTAECVEHIVLSQRESLEQIRQIIADDPDPDWHTRTLGKTDLVRRLVENASAQTEVRAPSVAAPTGSWGRRRAFQELYAARGDLLLFMETTPREIKNRTRESSLPQLGWMNAYDWLTQLASYTIRHSSQIEKIQSDPDYPQRVAYQHSSAPDPSYTDDEFAALIQDIDNGERTLHGLLKGMSEEQWAFKENPGRWSTGECVEHVSVGEEIITDAIERMFELPPNPQWYEQTRGKTEVVRRSVLARNPGGAGSPFRAPGEVAPTQSWDRATGFREFYRTHGKLRAYVETMPRDIKSRTFMNPFPQIGMLNSYDWLVLQALHVLRHSEQIAEIQIHPNYPR